MNHIEFKEIRNRLGLSVSMLAKIMNVSDQAVRKWEADPRHNMSREVNPMGARIMEWLRDGFRPKEFPSDQEGGRQ